MKFVGIFFRGSYCKQIIKNPHKREEPVSFKPTGDYEKILSNCTRQLHLMM